MKHVQVIQTSKYSDKKWDHKQPLMLDKKFSNKGNNDITVDPAKEYQEWLGFGGAFTEAAAYTLSQISPDNRQDVINAYFNKPEGLGYNLGRTHIHSCDFALENYTYVDENDTSLKSFSIGREYKYVIPLIKEAANKANKELTLLASPWSPPAWMKTNNEMNHGGKLKEEYRQTWANYFVKYIEEMESAGIPIWGVTVQNEPEATQVWDSCLYTAEEERDFIKDYLGPTFSKNGLADKKIIILDHNRDIMVERATTVLSDPEASKYIWGTGNHWYVSEEFENLSKVHEAFPDKHLIFTEGCIEGGVKLGAWDTGERYARNIIGDMNNWLEGFIDWNLVLNEQGGPNHVGNYCDAPVIADTKNDQVHFKYYYIGHFSKYIEPGAKRIDVNSTLESVSVTAFKNPNGEVVIVILNEKDEEHHTVLNFENGQTDITVPKRSITTCIIKS
ncbi:glycoside hydrolase family 30 protein [Salipaludibacillus aurantiacus]|uniref:Glucosylceramidase n=1 Tax=Salipaludibacillus aurantiacus TaxID=1601833 RepID=A0A1H9V347_9BACI|nr:glycoside hydrolase family 30 protein [Salipaludibacillus aurantiacus]SES15677.1 glucosylceramidase [Salipaludibacillus aurantiacus]